VTEQEIEELKALIEADEDEDALLLGTL